MKLRRLYIALHESIFVVILLGTGTAAAQKTPQFVPPTQTVDDLEEATGLISGPTVPQPEPELESLLSPWSAKGRGYFMVQGSASRMAPGSSIASGALVEIGATSDLKPSQKWTLFGEGRLLYQEDQEEAKLIGTFDQGGVRFRPVDQLLLVAGKERNRRAPGIVFSPSDFLHSDQNAPGLKEERGGIWQLRASLQMQNQSFDFVNIPYEEVRENGLPKDHSDSFDYALRYFARLPGGFDLGFDFGRIHEEVRVGAFVQTITFDVLKSYIELGDDREAKAQSFLLGTSYEGIPDVVLRAEAYHKDKRWKIKSPVFRDENYLVLTGSIVELGSDFNLTESWIRSMDSAAFANILRGDWLVSSRHTAGASVVHLTSNGSFQWQMLADWKFSI